MGKGNFIFETLKNPITKRHDDDWGVQSPKRNERYLDSVTILGR